jgi:hypothetical protein
MEKRKRNSMDSLTKFAKKASLQTEKARLQTFANLKKDVNPEWAMSHANEEDQFARQGLRP